MAYDNTNSGALFINDKKTPAPEDKRPDYKGNLNVNGVELDLAAWKRVSQKGTKFLSVKVSAKREASDGFQ